MKPTVDEIGDLPKVNPTLRAVLVGVGVVLILALLSTFGMCAHHCYSEVKKKERKKREEIVHLCRGECLSTYAQGSGPCDKEREAASKTSDAKAKEKYARLERSLGERIQVGRDKIGKLRKEMRDGKASLVMQSRIKALYKTVLKLQDDQLKLLHKKHREWGQRFGELQKKRSACVKERLTTCYAKCEKG